MIPSHYLAESFRRSLSVYVSDYLKEEVFAEGLTRNIPAFARFLDAVGYSHGELTNYSNIARDCGVDAKTVKEYFQILVDTLPATRVEPFKRRQSRQVITRAPKYYLFDVGVAGALVKRRITEERENNSEKLSSISSSWNWRRTLPTPSAPLRAQLLANQVRARSGFRSRGGRGGGRGQG